MAVVLAFTYCLFWWRNPFVAHWSCVGLFLRCSRSSSWPCRSEDFLLVKRKCNNCKRPRYQGSAKQESKTPRHKQQTPTQNQANPKENTLVPRCLGEKVKQTRPKIPALSPSPQWKRMTSLDSFSFHYAKECSAQNRGGDTFVGKHSCSKQMPTFAERSAHNKVK